MSAEHEHTLKFFGEELAQLKIDVEQLGALALAHVDQAVTTLQGEPDRTLRFGEDVREEAIRLGLQVERDAVRLIALRQPQAHDLRRAISAIKMLFVLQRVAALAHSAIRRCEECVTDISNFESNQSIAQVGKSARIQLKNAMTVYTNGEIGFAISVAEYDTQVDSAFEEALSSALSMVSRDTSLASDCTNIIFALKAFERIADYAAVIADISHYEMTNRTIAEAASDMEATSPVTS